MIPKITSAVAGNSKSGKKSQTFDAKQDAFAKQIRELAEELNTMLASNVSLSALHSRLDNFLISHPDLSLKTRNRVLLSKIEAALICRNYKASLDELHALLSTEPGFPNAENLRSTLKPELEKAIQLKAEGIDQAAAPYAFSLRAHTPNLSLDADGTLTRTSIEKSQIDRDAMLVEDQMHGILFDAKAHLRLREFHEALHFLNIFVGYGAQSEMVMKHDRELRPLIQRGLEKKSSGALLVGKDQHSNSISSSPTKRWYWIIALLLLGILVFWSHQKSAFQK